MPPRTRKTTSASDEAPQSDEAAQACPLCFPGGRLPEGAQTAGCEHGTWPPVAPREADELAEAAPEPAGE